MKTLRWKVSGIVFALLAVAGACGKKDQGPPLRTKGPGIPEAARAAEGWPDGLDDRRAVQVVPPALAAEIERLGIDRDVIGLDNWAKIKSVSKAVRESGLTAWGRAYGDIYRRTGFRDVPAVDSGENPHRPRSRQKSPFRLDALRSHAVMASSALRPPKIAKS